MKEKKPSLLRRFIHYYGPYKKLLIVDILMSTVITVCGLVYPLITRNIINVIVPDRNMKALIISAVALFAIYCVKLYANYWVMYYGHLLGVDMQNDMQKDIFSHLLTLPYTFFDEHKTGSLMSRVYNDLSDITELAHHGPEYFLQTTGSLIGSFIMLCLINWKLALIVFAFLPIMLFFLSSLRLKMEEGSMQSRKAISAINAELSNSLSGIRVAKAFNNSDGEMKKFAERAKDFKAARVLHFSSMATFNAGMDYLLDLMYLIVLTAGGIFYFKGIIAIGDFTAYFLYISAFFTPVRKLMNFVEMLEQGKTGFSRFCEIMDVPSESEKPDAKEATDLSGDIVFDDVTFSYNNNDSQNVLKNISLTIQNGKKTALVGPSGGGKTTMCHLIPRFYDQTEGVISIGGTDIRDYTRSSLRSGIGIVQQDVFLFTGTIADNISYSCPGATPEQIREAARKAKIDEFIESLPHGYDTYIGERGVMLSGGQKQRVAIARIFLMDPQILILDEATSALDNVTETELQAALDSLASDRTTIVVAHRLSTVRNADNILFITPEGVTEQGSHTQLMELNGSYASLYRSQFSEEQLEGLLAK